MASIPPLPPGRMTNQDIGNLIVSLHNCVEVTNTEVKRLRHEGKNQAMVVTGELRAVRQEIREVSDEVGDVSNRVSYIEGRQATIAERIGVPHPPLGETMPDTPVKPVFFITKSWKTLAAAAGSVGGLVLLYQILAAALPPILSALNSALLMAKP